MAEVSALEDAAQMGVLKQGPATYGYYRQPNGWITVSPSGELDELKYRKEGWEPLLEYGRVEMASEYMADHPLEVLFMGGGAKELCREQIIESGLHLDPPVVPVCGQALSQFHKRHVGTCWVDAKPVSFPQLDGVPSGVACRFCERPPFPTEKAREQHEGVMHKDEKSDIRTGETLADHLAKGLREGNAIAPLMPITEVADETMTHTVSDPYVCGHCGEGFNHPIKLASHVKEHKKNVDGAGGHE